MDKFKNATSLLESYKNLEREFTKKCQEVSKLKKELQNFSKYEKQALGVDAVNDTASGESGKRFDMQEGLTQNANQFEESAKNARLGVENNKNTAQSVKSSAQSGTAYSENNGKDFGISAKNLLSKIVSEETIGCSEDGKKSVEVEPTSLWQKNEVSSDEAFLKLNGKSVQEQLSKDNGNLQRNEEKEKQSNAFVNEEGKKFEPCEEENGSESDNEKEFERLEEVFAVNEKTSSAVENDSKLNECDSYDNENQELNPARKSEASLENKVFEGEKEVENLEEKGFGEAVGSVADEVENGSKVMSSESEGLSSENNIHDRFKSKSWKREVSAFVSKNPDAKPLLRDIAKILITRKDLAKLNDCLHIAYALAKSKPAERKNMTDFGEVIPREQVEGGFGRSVVEEPWRGRSISQEQKDEVLREYFSSFQKNASASPKVLQGGKGSSLFVTPATRLRSMDDANAYLLRMLRSK